MKKLIKRILQIFGLICLSIVLLTFFSAWQVYDYAKHKQKTYPKTADAVVVLGAAAWGKQPSPVFRERLNHAIYLYQKGFAKKIIFTGGTPKLNYPTEAEVGKRYAMQKFRVPERDILIETESNNTFDNLQNTRALIQSYRIRRMIIVSDPDHLARAAAMAAYLDMDVAVSATPTSLYYNNRMKRLKFALQEVLSLTAFRLTVLFQVA